MKRESTYVKAFISRSGYRIIKFERGNTIFSFETNNSGRYRLTLKELFRFAKFLLDGLGYD
jgi:hypothetical protein